MVDPDGEQVKLAMTFIVNSRQVNDSNDQNVFECLWLKVSNPTGNNAVNRVVTMILYSISFSLGGKT